MFSINSKSFAGSMLLAAGLLFGGYAMAAWMRRRIRCTRRPRPGTIAKRRR